MLVQPPICRRFWYGTARVDSPRVLHVCDVGLVEIDSIIPKGCAADIELGGGDRSVYHNAMGSIRKVIVNEESATATKEFIEKRLNAIKNQRKSGELEDLALIIGATVVL